MSDFIFIYGELINNILGLIICFVLGVVTWKVLKVVVFPLIALAWAEYGPVPRSKRNTVIESQEAKRCIIYEDGIGYRGKVRFEDGKINVYYD